MTDENGGCCDGGRMWWCGDQDDGESSERGRERMDRCGVGWRLVTAVVGGRRWYEDGGGGGDLVQRETKERTGTVERKEERVCVVVLPNCPRFEVEITKLPMVLVLCLKFCV